MNAPDELAAATARKRGEVLYAWVKLSNKEFVEKLAKESGLSMSVVVDSLLDKYREAHDRRGRKPGKRSS